MQICLRPNAYPVYGFLSKIQAQHQTPPGMPPRILDCGAGGPVPPLALFAQQGFETYGIDCSPEQLEKARCFCREHQLAIDLRAGDMRQIPFADGYFDYVFEHYAMCHLSHADTALAVSEMRRVLKPGGLCFLGVISTDSVPVNLFGEERGPGEFWMEEDPGVIALHSLFSDAQAAVLVQGWEVLAQEKVTRYLSGEERYTHLYFTLRKS